MAHIDIYEDNAFSCVELTGRAVRLPYQPGRLGELGLFEVDGIRTTECSIEYQNGALSLIPNTERDGPENEMNSPKREMFSFKTAHLPLRRTIRPSEIQNIREFGSETELMGAQSVADDKIKEMTPYHDATLEYQQLGAVKGILLDADGTTVIENLFTRFNIAQKTTAFALGTTTTKVRLKCLEAKRKIEDGLGGARYSYIRAMCGSGFFDKLISHPDVERAYERWQNGDMLRNDPRYMGFEFGGIIWEEYRGAVSGVSFVADQECHIFPMGVPGMYITRFAPANMMQFANTKGLPRYASREFLKHGRGVEILTESDPISLNKRPEATVKGTTN